MTAAQKTIAAPSQKAIAAIKAQLESATLQTIAAIAGNAASTLKGLSGTAHAIKGSVTTAVLGVVSKESIEDVAAPVKDVIQAAGGRVPNLSTIRGAVAKMAAAYGHASTLPHWGSVAEAKASGDAAFTALAESCFVDGALDAQKNVEAVSRIVTACAFLGIADNAVGKWRVQFGDEIAAIAARHETEQDEAEAGDTDTDTDAGIVADEAAQMAAELAMLREIAEQAARIFGTQDRAALAILMQEVPEIELTAAE